MEKKDLAFKVYDVDDEAGVFRGYALVYGVVDSLRELVEPGALTETIRKNAGVFPLCWFHNVKEPLGVAYVKDGQRGLLVEGHLNLDVQSAREKHSLMKQGVIKGLSIGFKTLKDEWDGDVRRLLEIELFEISPTTRNFQAVPGAEIEEVTAALNGEQLASADQARRDYEDYLRRLGKIHAEIHRECRR